MSKLYSKKEVKDSFWKVFHRSGEAWFAYDDEEDANDCTVSHWEDFENELDNRSKKRIRMLRIIDALLITFSSLIAFFLLYAKYGPFL